MIVFINNETGGRIPECVQVSWENKSEELTGCSF